MQFGELQAQLKMQVQKWQDERVQLLQEKDEERRQAVVSVRQQCQNDYQRFISDSKVTLSAALTSARQEHEQELVSKLHLGELVLYSFCSFQHQYFANAAYFFQVSLFGA